MKNDWATCFSIVEMKMPPPNVRFDEGRHLLVWKPLGTITEKIVNEILAFLTEKEALSSNPFNRFTDTSAQGPVEVSFAYIFHVSLYRRLSYSGRPPVKSAFFATDPEVARIVKIHALLTDHSPLQVALFDKPEEAALWLGVPISALTVE